MYQTEDPTVIWSNDGKAIVGKKEEQNPVSLWYANIYACIKHVVWSLSNSGPTVNCCVISTIR